MFGIDMDEAIIFRRHWLVTPTCKPTLIHGLGGISKRKGPQTAIAERTILRVGPSQPPVYRESQGNSWLPTWRLYRSLARRVEWGDVHLGWSSEPITVIYQKSHFRRTPSLLWSWRVSLGLILQGLCD